ncbi:hypothetical protein K458DRAFT_59304 [Lentithecium fluviatile CBS 122367]|uniref:Secreted protein n=1 Tax=Lentithecium fluviatile CBS 122367 TaxID=1168545 RepID=A0A6G1IWW1_9PLEO|nr:hypothetical protein K458DRAFT_59304 [Lentithecium fluviatile CBS 122367]
MMSDIIFSLIFSLLLCLLSHPRLFWKLICLIKARDSRSTKAVIYMGGAPYMLYNHRHLGITCARKSQYRRESTTLVVSVQAAYAAAMVPMFQTNQNPAADSVGAVRVMTLTDE